MRGSLAEGRAESWTTTRLRRDPRQECVLAPIVSFNLTHCAVGKANYNINMIFGHPCWDPAGFFDLTEKGLNCLPAPQAADE